MYYPTTLSTCQRHVCGNGSALPTRLTTAPVDDEPMHRNLPVAAAQASLSFRVRGHEEVALRSRAAVGPASATGVWITGYADKTSTEFGGWLVPFWDRKLPKLGHQAADLLLQSRSGLLRPC